MWSRSVVYIALAHRKLVTLGSCIAEKLLSAHSVIMGASMSTFTVAKSEEAFLSEHDSTAVSFWSIFIAMIAAIVFYYAEAGTVSSHWESSLHVGGLVTHVAALYYMYMRGHWVCVHKSLIVYRYIDWSITVPLQMIEFNVFDSV